MSIIKPCLILLHPRMKVEKRACYSLVKLLKGATDVNIHIKPLFPADFFLWKETGQSKWSWL